MNNFDGRIIQSCDICTIVICIVSYECCKCKVPCFLET